MKARKCADCDRSSMELHHEDASCSIIGEYYPAYNYWYCPFCGRTEPEGLGVGCLIEAAVLGLILILGVLCK